MNFKSFIIIILFLPIPSFANTDQFSCLFSFSDDTKLTNEQGLSAKGEKEAIKNIGSLLRSALVDTSNGSLSVGSVLQSLVSDLEISGLAISDEQETPGEPLTFTHNVNLLTDSEIEDHNASIQFRVFRNPLLDPDLAMMLGDERSQELSTRFDEFDDMELGFSYSWQNSSTGRTISGYIDEFNRLVMQNLETPLVKSLIDQRNLARVNYVEALDAEGVKNCAQPLVPDSSSSADIRATYLNALRSHEEVLEIYSAFNTVYQSKKFAALVSNQPQLIFSGFYRNRNELLGADELGLQVSYEMGFRNINGLRKFRKKSENAKLNYLESYKAYIAKNDPVLNNDRVAFSLALSQIDDFSFDDGTTSFLRQGGSRLTLNASYGRSILVRNDTPILRVDAGIEAVEFLGSSEGVDRLVGSATLTFRVDDKLSIPLTIQYANRGEFLSDDVDSLSANLGFKYDFDFAK